MRSTVHVFPENKTILRKCGDLPLAVIVTPMAGLTSSGGNVSGSSSSYATMTEGMDYIIHSEDGGDDENSNNDVADPERISVIRKADLNSNNNNDKLRVAVTPPRCDRCAAYFNPYCTSTVKSSFFQDGATYYNCPMCGASSSIKVSEEDIMTGTFDAATKCGTVEYEVDGPYCVRKDGPVQNVHLYGVEYVSPSQQNNTGTSTSTSNGDHHHHHHHHENVNSYGWYHSLNAIRDVGRSLSLSAPHGTKVRIGLFAYCRDMVVFPYLKETTGELAVAIMSDITVDPFCPLPLHVWTYDVGQGFESNEWKRFVYILDSFTELMEQLLTTSSSTGYDNTAASADPRPRERQNCGGAALAALADALHDSGGRATLITTRRPNYGVGALADREGRGYCPRNFKLQQQSPYRKMTDEHRLFTPLQRIARPPVIPGESRSKTDEDTRAGEFYYDLGELCARQRICIDIVVMSSLVSIPPHPQPGQEIQSNVREFVDVPTLSELCRHTCGRFKWLRVGNECGVAVMTDNDNNTDDDGNAREGRNSFAAEQLREELKRSALAYAGNDAVFKFRCSNGMQVKSYCPTLPIGTLVGEGIVDSAELELSSIHSGMSIAVLLEYKIGGVQDTRRWGGRQDNGANLPPMVFFQSAVLYTTLSGRRRMRVSTIGLATTKVPADVYRSADLGTIAAIFTRQAITDVEDPNVGFHAARLNVFDKTVSILANYRMHTTAKTSPTSQLVLPETLQLLPMFALSLRKSRLLRCSLIGAPGKRPFPNADERAYHMFYGRNVSPNMSLQCVHSNVFQLSEMRTLDGEWRVPPTLETSKYAGEKAIAASMQPTCQLPRGINPSIACLDEKGMYILDDRFAFYLIIGKGVPQEAWQDLISVSSPPGSHRVGGEWMCNVPMGTTMKLASTESGRKLRNIVRQLRMLNLPNSTLAMNARHTYAPIVLIFAGRGSVFEEEMDSLLVDDTDGREKNYSDFLVHIHKEVQMKAATLGLT